MKKSHGPLAVLLAVGLALPAAAQDPLACPDPYAGPNAFGPGLIPPGPDAGHGHKDAFAEPPMDEARGCLQSDYAFPCFIGPISNPFLSKDPRSLTELRMVFINDEIPSDHPLHGGNFQIIGVQARVALTDRLTFIADKSGYAWIHPGAGGSETDGFLNVAAGLKYLIIRDVPDQFLWSVGAQFEPQTGEGRVLQSQGDGVWTAFTTAGKQLGEWHVLGTFGYQFPADRSQNSSFYYASAHLDRQVCHFLYPLVEFNWFHYDHGGNRGIPPSFGEGDGLLNIGTSGVAGNDLTTVAFGLKAAICPNLETGAAWEIPITGRKDLIDNRVTFEVIVRY
jgi:hypothetical protein